MGSEGGSQKSMFHHFGSRGFQDHQNWVGGGVPGVSASQFWV